MPFHCAWKIPGKVLFADVGPDLPMEEVELLGQVIARHVFEEGQPPVYFIIDLTALQSAPQQLSQLHRSALGSEAEQIGCYIFIVSNQSYAFVAAAFIKLRHRPVRIVSTWSEAIAAVQEFDPEMAAGLSA